MIDPGVTGLVPVTDAGVGRRRAEVVGGRREAMGTANSKSGEESGTAKGS
jgi:hypothetical protein